MLSYKKFREEDGVDYFVIEMPKEFVPKAALLNEGQWVPTGKKDWMQRVDAANPAINQQRHVHVARTKHISSKAMQASWNADGTKHDKMSFNSKIASIGVVQDIAKKSLSLPNDFALEKASSAASTHVQLNESMGIGITPVIFVLRMS